MSENSNPSQLFKNFSRLIVYTALALAVFFGIAVFVFVLRGQDQAKSPMPDLISKYYVDVHNDMQRLQLRVKLVKKHYPDQGTGVILSQSIPAGRNVAPREQLYLVVNQPEPVLSMPDFKRSSLASAQAAITKITYESRVYSLAIGAITEFETEAFPDNTVIDQFPEAGVNVIPGQKVYFLIARKKNTAQQAREALDIKSLIGQNVSIVIDYLNKQGKDYRITEIKSEENPDKQGTVFSIAEKGMVHIGIIMPATKTRFRNGLELVELELSEPGRCVAQLRHLRSDKSLINEDGPRQVFITQNHTDDEKVKIVFFRQGNSRLDVQCGDKSVYTEKFEPDDLS